MSCPTIGSTGLVNGREVLFCDTRSRQIGNGSPVCLRCRLFRLDPTVVYQFLGNLAALPHH